MPDAETTELLAAVNGHKRENAVHDGCMCMCVWWWGGGGGGCRPPARHDTHDDELFDPVTGEYVPDGHGVQVEDDVADVIEEYLPDAQEVQTDAEDAEYVPDTKKQSYEQQ